MKKLAFLFVLAASVFGLGFLSFTDAGGTDLPSQHSNRGVEFADLPSQHSDREVELADLPSQHSPDGTYQASLL